MSSNNSLMDSSSSCGSDVISQLGASSTIVMLVGKPILVKENSKFCPDFQVQLSESPSPPSHELLKATPPCATFGVTRPAELETKLLNAVYMSNDILLQSLLDSHTVDSSTLHDLLVQAVSKSKVTTALLLTRLIGTPKCFGVNPLYHEFVVRHSPLAEYFLTTCPQSLHLADPSGVTPLHRAAGCGSVAVVNLFIRNTAEINAQDTQGRSPLHRAAHYGRRDVAAALLAAGADPNIRDNYGRGPLWYATMRNYVSIAVYLFEHGADPRALDFQHQSVLDVSSPRIKSFLLKEMN